MRKLTFMLLSTAMALSCSSPGDNSKESNLITRSSIVAENNRLTPEIMHSMGKVGDPQLSPDGQEILYGVGFTSIDQNRNNRELFIMNIDGSNNRQITQTSQSESNARWINNGNSIMYLRAGQIWIMDKDGKNQKQISNHTNYISEFKLSPDQSKVLFVSKVKSAKKAYDIWPDLDKASGRLINDLMYRHWDHFVEEIPHPFIAEFDGKTIKNSFDILEGLPYECPTLPLSGIEQLNWSPDGKYIAYSSRKLTGRDYAFSTNTDIYLYNISDKSSINLTEGMPGYDTEPVFSPDGKFIAWLSMERAGFEADKSRLFIIDLETKEKKDLTIEYKYNANYPVWDLDSKSIFFTSCVNAVTHVYNIDIESKNIRQITDGWFTFDKVAVTPDRLYTTYKSMSFPNEIVSIDRTTGEFTQITNENKHIFDQLKLGNIEERWIKTVDNKDMHMWVVYPPDFDPNKVYPTIVYCLGGPQGTLSQNWSYRWNFQLMAANDYIIVLPNRRGTTAFGQEWTDQISGDYMGLNIQDYLSAAREIKKEKYTGKLSAVGASYGGFSVFYLAGIHQGLFSAFIAHAGIFNQEHMYMTTEELFFPHWDNGGAPWDDNPVAKRHYANSAHKLVKNWDTPILITHGELDYRVPVDQGMAAFNAAQILGVPSQLLLFPDENHWILKPQNSIQWNRVFFDWLDKWTK